MKTNAHISFYCRAKIIIVISFLLLSVPRTYGQIGIRVGMGISDIGLLAEGQVPFFGYEINSLMHNWPLPSYQAGLIYNYPLGQRFNLNTGLLFSQQGFNCNNTFLYDYIVYRLHISYLKLPATLKFKTKVSKGKHSGIVLGPYVSGTLRAILRTEVEGQLEKREMDNVNGIDFGCELGYTWDIGKQPGKFLLDLRCSYSLINSINAQESYIPWYYGPDKIYARNINIVLACEYMIK